MKIKEHKRAETVKIYKTVTEALDAKHEQARQFLQKIDITKITSF
jgi:ribosomal protein L21